MAALQPAAAEDRHPRNAWAPEPKAAQPAGSPTIALTIISNSRLLCEGLSSLLPENLQVESIACLPGDNQRVPGPATQAKHIVLLDSGVGHEAALGWTRYWRGLASPSRVIVLELSDDSESILACIEAGACGYTLRGASMADLVATIERAYHDQAICSPELTAKLFARLAAARAQPLALHVPLTAREMEVLRYVASGYSNQAIATRLVIEVRTVKHHVHNILGKLNLHHRGEAARYAEARGWIR
jgi:two-component system nitrate/nitrite response regulator NarL